MARHIVTVKELEEWMNKDAACSLGNGSSKSLEMSNDKTFRVKNHGTAIYIGKDLAAAVDAYNAAP